MANSRMNSKSREISCNGPPRPPPIIIPVLKLQLNFIVKHEKHDYYYTSMSVQKNSTEMRIAIAHPGHVRFQFLY